MLSIIVAVSENGVIGKNNKLPWNISEDKMFFKKMTSGKTVVMGRLTYESIGKKLKDRQVIVLSKKKSLNTATEKFIDSIEKILKLGASQEETFIAGGAKVYLQFLPFCKKIYLTRILKKVEGDAYFPEIDKNIWQQTYESKIKTDKATGIRYVFTEYNRKESSL